MFLFAGVFAAGLLLGFGSNAAGHHLRLHAELASRLALARTAGRWQEYVAQDEGLADSLGRIAWRQVRREFALARGDFHAGYPSIPGPDCSDPCPQCVHRSFLVDGQFLRFTETNRAEDCNDFPRLAWRTRAGRRFSEPLVPLYGLNVEALWCTGQFVVLGLHAELESVQPLEALALWNLDTGEWAFAPYGQQVATYSVGLALTGIFPTWPDVRVAQVNDAVVLSDSRRAVTLWPGLHEWGVQDARTGAPIERGPGAAPSRAIFKRPTGIEPEMLAGIRAELSKADSIIGPAEILEIMAPACPPDTSLAVVLAHASTAHGALGDSGELFGVFLADRRLGGVCKTLETFPELRHLDYEAFFVAETASDSIVVIGQGSTYGDAQVVHRFDCRGGK